MYKSELARAAGVSSATFRRWIARNKSELENLGNSPNAKLLNPAGVKYLCDFYVIELED